MNNNENVEQAIKELQDLQPIVHDEDFDPYNSENDLSGEDIIDSINTVLHSGGFQDTDLITRFQSDELTKEDLSKQLLKDLSEQFESNDIHRYRATRSHLVIENQADFIAMQAALTGTNVFDFYSAGDAELQAQAEAQQAELMAEAQAEQARRQAEQEAQARAHAQEQERLRQQQLLEQQRQQAELQSRQQAEEQARRQAEQRRQAEEQARILMQRQQAEQQAQAEAEEQERLRQQELQQQMNIQQQINEIDEIDLDTYDNQPIQEEIIEEDLTEDEFIEEDLTGYTPDNIQEDIQEDDLSNYLEEEEVVAQQVDRGRTKTTESLLDEEYDSLNLEDFEIDTESDSPVYDLSELNLHRNNNPSI